MTPQTYDKVMHVVCALAMVSMNESDRGMFKDRQVTRCSETVQMVGAVVNQMKQYPRKFTVLERQLVVGALNSLGIEGLLVPALEAFAEAYASNSLSELLRNSKAKQ